MAENDSKTVQTRSLRPELFMMLSVLVGVVAGFGAVVFRGLIAFFHNLLFLGKLSLFYDANIHTPASPWGPLVILVPVVGAAAVAFLVKNFAPEAKGHGVPEVMDAIYYNRGRIRPIVAVIKSLASAISIGSGGSIGREGPIIQIGSSFGSTIGGLLRLSSWQRIALIAGGAGGGIAATFNTPVGGVLFAQEILMREISARTLVPVAIATVTATYIGRIIFGAHPSFVIPALEIPSSHQTDPVVLLAFVGLGAIMGVVSALFIKSIYGFEDLFDQRIGGSYYKKHLLGMVLVGIIMYILMAVFGHYYVEGVGYAAVQDILSKNSLPLYLLLLLFVLKLLTTSLTLGSGASGGIFSPSLFMGATLGGAYGLIISWLLPQLGINPAVFAIAGMAGLVGGATGAAIAAVVMIFEMTLDYNVIIPMTIVVAISYGLRRVLSPESIYTMKLARRGHYIPTAMVASPRYATRAGQIMLSEFAAVPASVTLTEFAKIVSEQPSILYFLVEDRQKVVGFLRNEIARKPLKEADAAVKVGDIAAKDFAVVGQHDVLLDIIYKMHSSKASIAIVTDHSASTAINDVKGLITRQNVSDAMIEAAELFVD
jgi:CIC family chloride channel protein